MRACVAARPRRGGDAAPPARPGPSRGRKRPPHGPWRARVGRLRSRLRAPWPSPGQPSGPGGRGPGARARAAARRAAAPAGAPRGGPGAETGSKRTAARASSIFFRSAARAARRSAGLGPRVLRGLRRLGLRLEIVAQGRGLASSRGHPPSHGQALAHRREARFPAAARRLRLGQLLPPRGQDLRGGVLVVARELAPDEVGLALRVGRAAVGDLLHLDVDVEVQEGDQDLVALLGLALQEGVELALGQHHRAGEGLVVEAHDLLDLLLDVLHPSGQG